jgi:hypothetical protein
MAAPQRARWPERWIAVFLVMVVVIAVAVALIAPGGGPATVQDVSSALNQPGGVGEMNPTVSKLIAVAILLIVPLLLWAWMHNTLVAKEESVFEAWAQTESNFQRRADLVPALVESVSRYIQHESETLTGIARDRGQAVGPGRPETDARPVVEPQPPTLGLFLGNLQPLPSPDALHPFGIHMPAFGPQQGGDPSIAVSAILTSQADDCCRQGILIRPATGYLALGRAMLANNTARSALGDTQLDLQMIDTSPATGGAQ